MPLVLTRSPHPLHPYTSVAPQEALDKGDAELRVKAGLDVGPLPAMLAYDGRLSYSGAPAKAAAHLAAHAQWGELLASVAAVRDMLPGVRAGGRDGDRQMPPSFCLPTSLMPQYRYRNPILAVSHG